jgi:hypothetical protein
MFGTFSFYATKRIRCDKNRKFVVERTAFFQVFPGGLWDDHETVTLTFPGGPPIPQPASTAAQAWENDYPPRSPAFDIQLNGPSGTDTVSKSNSGACKSVACQTFSYNASLEAVPQLN